MARLIDADKLIEQGWVLTRHGIGNRLIERKSIADVPTSCELDDLMEENALLRAKLNFSKLKGGVSDD